MILNGLIGRTSWVGLYRVSTIAQKLMMMSIVASLVDLMILAMMMVRKLLPPEMIQVVLLSMHILAWKKNQNSKNISHTVLTSLIQDLAPIARSFSQVVVAI